MTDIHELAEKILGKWENELIKDAGKMLDQEIRKWLESKLDFIDKYQTYMTFTQIKEQFGLTKPASIASDYKPECKTCSFLSTDELFSVLNLKPWKYCPECGKAKRP